MSSVTEDNLDNALGPLDFQPCVYKRAWTGLPSHRLVGELLFLLKGNNKSHLVQRDPCDVDQPSVHTLRCRSCNLLGDVLWYVHGWVLSFSQSNIIFAQLMVNSFRRREELGGSHRYMYDSTYKQKNGLINEIDIQ